MDVLMEASGPGSSLTLQEEATAGRELNGAQQQKALGPAHTCRHSKPAADVFTGRRSFEGVRRRGVVEQPSRILSTINLPIWYTVVRSAVFATQVA